VVIAHPVTPTPAPIRELPAFNVPSPPPILNSGRDMLLDPSDNNVILSDSDSGTGGEVEYQGSMRDPIAVNRGRKSSTVAAEKSDLHVLDRVHQVSKHKGSEVRAIAAGPKPSKRACLSRCICLLVLSKMLPLPLQAQGASSYSLNDPLFGITRIDNINLLYYNITRVDNIILHVTYHYSCHPQILKSLNSTYYLYCCHNHLLLSILCQIFLQALDLEDALLHTPDAF